MIIFVKLSLYQNKYQKIILGWTSPLNIVILFYKVYKLRFIDFIEEDDDI